MPLVAPMIQPVFLQYSQNQPVIGLLAVFRRLNKLQYRQKNVIYNMKRRKNRHFQVLIKLYGTCHHNTWVSTELLNNTLKSNFNLLQMYSEKYSILFSIRFHSLTIFLLFRLLQSLKKADSEESRGLGACINVGVFPNTLEKQSMHHRQRKGRASHFLQGNQFSLQGRLLHNKQLKRNYKAHLRRLWIIGNYLHKSKYLNTILHTSSTE